MPQQAGSWTKKKTKDSPIHFGRTAPLIFHRNETKKEKKVMHHQSIHPPTWYESKKETNYKYPSEPKMNPRCLQSVSHVCLSDSFTPLHVRNTSNTV